MSAVRPPLRGPVRVALVGAGTVGQGFLRILQRHHGLLSARAGTRLELAWVCDRVRRPLPLAAGRRPRFTTDWRRITADPGVHIVVELMGGEEPARTLILESLRAGKQVATANKAVLSRHWGEIHTAARLAGALVYFEAAVGGGIPIIQGLNEGLAANRIERIHGILNGTTNYILTRMTEEGLDFKSALAAAQAAGFAERNPDFDIAGVDAAHKLAILASLAAGGWVRVEDVYREGIASLDVWDVAFAREELGLAVKLLALAELGPEGVLARVHPALIPTQHPFATVRHEYNAIIVHGDSVGDVMFYGRGAGKMPAASAVASDVAFLARQVAAGSAGRSPTVAHDAGRRAALRRMEDRAGAHYFRFSLADRPGALARLTRVLSRQGISIASLHQESPFKRRARRGVPVVVVTHTADERAVRAAIREADRLPGVARRAVHLRIETLK